jgi:nicotinamide-nucleotide amidase
MKAEIITIGDEILIGQVIDTNSAWIGQELNRAGVRVNTITSISDEPEAILDALKAAESRAGIVLITGGLGPTNDDITKNILCKYFNTRLVFNQEVFKDVERFISSRGGTVNKNNRDQALVPEKAKILRNNLGTAPGLEFSKDGTSFFAMPGVPYEMKSIVTKYVLPFLTENSGNEVISHKTILTSGIAEARLADMLIDWEGSLPDGFKLAYLPSPGSVRLRLSAYGMDKGILVDQQEKLISDALQLIGNYVYGFDNDRMEEVVGKMLLKRGKSLATAESCSGGRIASLITSIPGSSRYFLGSVVAYSNQLKEKLLGVDKDLLEKHGAVCEPTVKAMLKGVLKTTTADYALVTSGIAGPGGGTPEKPVGTIWIGAGSTNNHVIKKYTFGDERERNIIKTSFTALNMLRKLLMEENQ